MREILNVSSRWPQERRTRRVDKRKKKGKRKKKKKEKEKGKKVKEGKVGDWRARVLLMGLYKSRVKTKFCWFDFSRGAGLTSKGIGSKDLKRENDNF